MFGLGPTELIIILLIVVVIFGAKRLPDIGKGLGGALKEFRKVKKDLSAEKETPEVEEGEKTEQNKNNPSALENKVADKLLEQVPGVKKAVEIKNKAEQVKKLIE